VEEAGRDVADDVVDAFEAQRPGVDRCHNFKNTFAKKCRKNWRSCLTRLLHSMPKNDITF
jgi:hypothetical protein